MQTRGKRGNAGTSSSPVASVVASAKGRLQAIGYWYDERAPSAYPRPQLLVGKWAARDRRAVLAYLRAGAVFETYRAHSHCRFNCGTPMRDMGRRDLADARYVWPEGLAHYVEAHGVLLPPTFVRHVLAAVAAKSLPPSTLWHRRAREGLVDDAAWIAWGMRQGAGEAQAAPAWLTPALAKALRAELRKRT
ncbi:MAG: hypothetical protein IPL79_19825 [Myxococcales bacterium]|nr:hypothetical protein [Myxococcales bacterium]